MRYEKGVGVLMNNLEHHTLTLAHIIERKQRCQGIFAQTSEDEAHLRLAVAMNYSRLVTGGG